MAIMILRQKCYFVALLPERVERFDNSGV